MRAIHAARLILATALAGAALLGGSALLGACGSAQRPNTGAPAPRATSDERASSGSRSKPDAVRALALDRARTRPFGRGGRFRPPPFGAAVRARHPVADMSCGPGDGSWYGVHVELFAEGHEIAVPAGIGIAPPQRRVGGSVIAGACEYPLRTADPTGVVLVNAAHTRSTTPTLGMLFALWDQPLSGRRLAGFSALLKDRVSAFVNGWRAIGDPRAVQLRDHAQIVLEVGPYVEPHPAYRFAPGV